jgi:hypothetical protein
MVQESRVLNPRQGRREIIDWHPGKGKTRKVILEVAKSYNDMRRSLAILEPTRVVMSEIMKVLEENNIPVKTRKSTLLQKGVTVMCHATFFDAVIKNSSIMKRGIDGIVMDEAHFMDSKSLAVRGVMERLNESKQTNIWYLTATPPGKTTLCDSNYTITDVVMKENEEKQLVKFLNTLKGKTIVFVPSRSEADKYAKIMINSIALHRNNFVENYDLAKSDVVKRVFTTDISEMGANFNAENVVDLRTTNKPTKLCENIIDLNISHVTYQSMNQRRGRIGRRKPGNYYHADKECLVRMEGNTIIIEAQMLMDQLDDVHGMCEEIDMFEPSGKYSLDERNKQLFFSCVMDENISNVLTIYTIHFLIDNGFDPRKGDWLFAGNDEKEIVFKTGIYKNRKLNPIVNDARVMSQENRNKLEQLYATDRRHATGRRGGATMIP